MTLTGLKALSLDPGACISGTPMVPLHQNTIAAIVAIIEAADAMREPLAAIGPEPVRELVHAYDAARAKLRKT